MHAQSGIQEQYNVALDRKLHPAGEKSYTNYLYNQGLDTILKKCGEEAFETVVAAKNDDPDEIVGEINDLLYNVTVLLCHQDVTLESVMEELNTRCAAREKEIDELFEVVLQRRDAGDGKSYTAYLFEKGLDKILKKVGEAATMLLIAGKGQDSTAIAYETADLLYHILVMMAAKQVSMEAVADEMDRRLGKTGNLKTFHTTDLNT